MNHWRITTRRPGGLPSPPPPPFPTRSVSLPPLHARLSLRVHPLFSCFPLVLLVAWNWCSLTLMMGHFPRKTDYIARLRDLAGNLRETGALRPSSLAHTPTRTRSLAHRVQTPSTDKTKSSEELKAKTDCDCLLYFNSPRKSTCTYNWKNN